ncbi:MAG: hypothetical protein KZQ83_12395 [gamma proteobacterium symbiont of Taylorina sp.]|nr:hypothetical protein [gamma proteobacterium symbiont of Taylorina sp.]
MKIKELIDKMDDFFDLSKKKQKAKNDKFLKLIKSLEDKKDRIKKEIRKEAKKDKKSKACYNLCKEFKAINKLLKKAKKHGV